MIPLITSFSLPSEASNIPVRYDYAVQLNNLQDCSRRQIFLIISTEVGQQLQSKVYCTLVRAEQTFGSTSS